MVEMLALLVILLGAGMWTKHTNTLYMRKLAEETWINNGGPIPLNMKRRINKIIK